MKLIKVLAFVLILAMLGTPMLAKTPTANAPTPYVPIYYSVEPSPNPPLTNLNVSTLPDGNRHGLETPGGASTPVTQYFNVTINLRNATVANVENQTVYGLPSDGVNASGIWGIEVHLDFSQFAFDSFGNRVCEPVAFTSMVGNASQGGVFTQGDINHRIAYGIKPGFYDNSGNYGNPVAPGLATQFAVAAASTLGPWNATVGIIANVTFEIMGAPSALPDFYEPIHISFANMVATTDYPNPQDTPPITGPVPFYIIDGTLKIDHTNGQTYDSAAIAIPSPIYKYSAALGYTCIVNATVLNNATVTAAFNVKLLLNTTAVGIATVQSLAPSTQLNVTIYGYTSIIGVYSYNNVSISTEPVLGETLVSNNGPVTLNAKNWKTGYYVMITIPGDFSSDRCADIVDLTVLAHCYNAPFSGKPYNPNCDVKDAGTDDLVDLTVLAGHYNYPNGTDLGWTHDTY
jgi:hypothetical protein